MRRGGRLRQAAVAAGVVAAVLTASMSFVGSASAGEPAAPATPQRGSKPHSNTNLVDHGGPVLAASHVYAIWWGPKSGFPSDAQAYLTSMFNGLDGTSFLGISGQYMRSAAVHTAFVASGSYSSAPPSRSPAVSTIVSEVGRAIQANGWTADPSAIYFVYTSNFPGHVNFCAWHSDGTLPGTSTTVQVAYMPNTAGVAGCDPGNLYGVSGSQGARSLANVSSHEFMEAITDPQISAWYDQSGSEIGDKCAWQFASAVTLSTGSYQLQEEWSNSARGCVQQ